MVLYLQIRFCLPSPIAYRSVATAIKNLQSHAFRNFESSLSNRRLSSLPGRLWGNPLQIPSSSFFIQLRSQLHMNIFVSQQNYTHISWVEGVILKD